MVYRRLLMLKYLKSSEDVVLYSGKSKLKDFFLDPLILAIIGATVGFALGFSVFTTVEIPALSAISIVSIIFAIKIATATLAQLVRPAVLMPENYLRLKETKSQLNTIPKEFNPPP